MALLLLYAIYMFRISCFFGEKEKTAIKLNIFICKTSYLNDLFYCHESEFEIKLFGDESFTQKIKVQNFVTVAVKLY